MKVLVTGASGFVGGNLALLLSSSYEVFAHYHSKTPEVRISDSSTLVQADLRCPRSTKELIQTVKPDCIMHSAGHARTVYCEQNPEQAQELNVGATQILLSAAAELEELPLFIFCSSDLVFEGFPSPKQGILEDDEPKPITKYSKSKIEAEELVKNYPGLHSIFRLALVYGPKVNQVQGFLSWMRSRLENGEECDLFIDEFRSPVCVVDIAAAVNKVVELGQNGKTIPQILNITGSEKVSRRDFGEHLCEHAKYPKHLITTRSQKGFSYEAYRPEDVTLNCDKFSKVLGRSPMNISEGLKHCEIQEDTRAVRHERSS